MPWWFWVISHIWVACSTGLLVGFLMGKEFEGDPWPAQLFMVFLCLFGPVTITFAFIGAWISNKYEWDKVKEKWFFREMRKLKDRWLGRKLRQMFKWIKHYRERQKDFKEIEDNEDEWTAERVGIKLK